MTTTTLPIDLPPAPPYRGSLQRRVVRMDNPRHELQAPVFDCPAARAINAARLDHLATLGLPLDGRRVLDAGCGVGHLAQFFIQRHCDVTCVDARPQNIARLRELYPTLPAHVADVQRQPLATIGRFDVVFCYGLLYHLEDPIAGLRNLASACDDLLLIETVICDSTRPVVRLIDEYASHNQAMDGIGTRPSPAYIAMTLNRIGFDHVYMPVTVPDHDDFRFAWQDNLDIERDGHLLRCVFVAARHELQLPTLRPMLTDPPQSARRTA